MSKRHGMSRGHSAKQFSKHASKTHFRNTPGGRTVMRGGIRL